MVMPAFTGSLRHYPYCVTLDIIREEGYAHWNTLIKATSPFRHYMHEIRLVLHIRVVIGCSDGDYIFRYLSNDYAIVPHGWRGRP